MKFEQPFVTVRNEVHADQKQKLNGELAKNEITA